MSLCMCIFDDIEVEAIAIDAATILEIKGKRWSHCHSNQVYNVKPGSAYAADVSAT